MQNITEFINGTQIITNQNDLVVYAADIFKPSIIFIFSLVLIIQLIIGMVVVKKERANFYAIFLLIWIIIAILLFLTFWFPVIPEFVEKIIGGYY